MLGDATGGGYGDDTYYIYLGEGRDHVRGHRGERLEEHLKQLKASGLAARIASVSLGDEIALSYVVPMPREEGRAAAENISVNRITRRFTVSGIALQNGLFF